MCVPNETSEDRNANRIDKNLYIIYIYTYLIALIYPTITVDPSSNKLSF